MRHIMIRLPIGTLADPINKVQGSIQVHLLYATSTYSGDYNYSCFLWTDYKETAIDILRSFYQVAGHAQVSDNHPISFTAKSITYVDVRNQQVKFHKHDI